MNQKVNKEESLFNQIQFNVVNSGKADISFTTLKGIKDIPLHAWLKAFRIKGYSSKICFDERVIEVTSLSRGDAKAI